MNFRGHFVGGAVAGAAAGALMLVSGYSGLGGAGTAEALAGSNEAGAHLVGVMLTAWFMALFPDLDTASIPQRWFLRGMFALLIAALAWGRLDLFVLLAFAALLPLIHRHRGWTHWRITPWVIPLFLASIHEYLRAQSSWFLGFSWENVWEFLGRYWIYVAASVLGHYTHLLLDSRRVKWLPFVRNSEGHH